MVAVGADISAEQFAPSAFQHITVGTAHAHGIEIDYLGAAQIGIFKQRFGLDEQRQLAQERLGQFGVTLPLEVGRHLIAMEIAALIQERDVHVTEQFAAHAAILVAGKR